VIKAFEYKMLEVMKVALQAEIALKKSYRARSRDPSILKAQRTNQATKAQVFEDIGIVGKVLREAEYSCSSKKAAVKTVFREK
jgi:hypothetical protein